MNKACRNLGAIEHAHFQYAKEDMQLHFFKINLMVALRQANVTFYL